MSDPELQARAVELVNEVERLNSLLAACREIVGADRRNQDVTDDILKQHVWACPQHPLSAALQRAEKAKAELARAREVLRECSEITALRAEVEQLEQEPGEEKKEARSNCPHCTTVMRAPEPYERPAIAVCPYCGYKEEKP